MRPMLCSIAAEFTEHTIQTMPADSKSKNKTTATWSLRFISDRHDKSAKQVNVVFCNECVFTLNSRLCPTNFAKIR